MILSIELPWPPAALMPNRRLGKHWSSTNAVKVKYLADCHALALQAARQAGFEAKPGRIQVELLFLSPDRRRRDIDGLMSSCKALVDGVATALKVDDFNFRPMVLDERYDGKPGKVLMTLTQ